jgi:P3 major capsid protein
MAQATQPTAQQLQQLNTLARQLITSQAILRKNQIFSVTVVPANQNVINVPIQNVGLILGFYVTVAFTAAASTGSAALTQFGPANVLSQVVFNDLNNNTRIQTPGWHLHLLNTVKNRAPYAAAKTLSSYPINYGANFPGQITAVAATATPQTAYMTYWVPLAYSNFDLRGSIYANVFNATAALQLTINPAPFAASGDATSAIWSGETGSITSATVTVYQVYYDQLPVGQNGSPVLPAIDLGVAYMLNQTALTGMVSTQDFPYTYANFRDFLSTFAVYDNGGTLGTGSDITYWKLLSANFTSIWQLPPPLVALETRNLIGDDLPDGTYYFDTRTKPISSYQYGNMQLIMNPAGTVNANAALLVAVESFAQINTVVGAASLAAG